MNKWIVYLFSASLFTTPAMVYAASDADTAAALQAEVSQLKTAQQDSDKQFDKAYNEIKKVEKQLPQLSDKIQAQLKEMQDNNNKMISEIQQSNEAQIKALTEQLNTLKERLSKKVSEES